MIEFTGEREKGGVLDYHSIGLTTLLELTHPVSLKGSISIIGEEEARMSIINSLERIICFGNKITCTYKSIIFNDNELFNIMQA